MKYSKKYVIFLSFLICSFAMFFTGCNNQHHQQFGVWWWDDTLDYSYLDYAQQNKINEIYYCNSSFDSHTENFIIEANNRNIKVFYLAGEYQWLNDSSNLIAKIDKLIDYNNSHQNAKFAGIHLDIEPHQAPEFKQSNDMRNMLITKLVELAYYLSEQYPNLFIDYDLPFWLDDEVSINNITKPAYAHIIDVASRVTLMSYRDSAQEIYSVAEDEINYAINVNKTLVLGVETYSTEGDNVSFFEEGKTVLFQEIENLRKLIPSTFGIAVHHIKTLYELKP